MEFVAFHFGWNLTLARIQWTVKTFSKAEFCRFGRRHQGKHLVVFRWAWMRRKNATISQKRAAANEINSNNNKHHPTQNNRLWELRLTSNNWNLKWPSIHAMARMWRGNQEIPNQKNITIITQRSNGVDVSFDGSEREARSMAHIWKRDLSDGRVCIVIKNGNVWLWISKVRECKYLLKNG